MNLKAYAKINWYLRVIDKRPDQYHNLEMIMQHIDLYDELCLRPLPARELRLVVKGPANLPDPEDNLIIKAARLLQLHSRSDQGAYIELKKHIPIGAGLGGGSSDAAAVLTGLNQLWELNFTRLELQRIGLKIGADVPFCLEPGPALVTGIGEGIEPIDLGKEAWLILLKPETSLSTARVFSGYRPSSEISFDLKKSIDAIRERQYDRLYKVGGNALLSSASNILPEIESLFTALNDHGAVYTQMSGSGSAVFGVFRSKSDAQSAFERIKGPFMKILTKTLKTAEAL